MPSLAILHALAFHIVMECGHDQGRDERVRRAPLPPRVLQTVKETGEIWTFGFARLLMQLYNKVEIAHLVVFPL